MVLKLKLLLIDKDFVVSVMVSEELTKQPFKSVAIAEVKEW
jgi:hypothetical protein